jgi:ankyrin repeat and LEM domain-containing protein 1
VFRIFIASIFYVGKGTRSRPYAHLYDALKIWKADSENTKKKVKEDVNV